MSANRDSPSIDERVRRTNHAIARAIIALGEAHPLDAITVGMLAREAGISRSTFYAHYASLSDYLSRSFARMLVGLAQKGVAEDGSRADILPVRDILDHIHSSRDYALRIDASEQRAAIYAAGEIRLRSLARDRLTQTRPRLDSDDSGAAATYIVGGFMGMLRAWLAGGLSEPTELIEDRFRRMTRLILAGLDDGTPHVAR